MSVSSQGVFCLFNLLQSNTFLVAGSFVSKGSFQCRATLNSFFRPHLLVSLPVVACCHRRSIPSTGRPGRNAGRQSSDEKKVERKIPQKLSHTHIQHFVSTVLTLAQCAFLHILCYFVSNVSNAHPHTHTHTHTHRTPFPLPALPIL